MQYKHQLPSSPMTNPDIEPLCRSQKTRCSSTKLCQYTEIDFDKDHKLNLTHTTLGTFTTFQSEEQISMLPSSITVKP